MKSERPVVAVSACLLGQKVRYDGTDKRNETILGALAGQMDYRPFCPEVGIGLSVPRAPLQLVQQESGVHVLGVADRTWNVTESLHAYGREMALRWRGVCGVIFKCRSPSCGLTSVPLYDYSGELLGTATGAFAEEIATALPELPMVEEEALVDQRQYDSFIHRVMARHATR